MGRCTIMLDGKFMEWTSISDSPSSLLLTEEQFRIYWKQTYGLSRWHELPEVLLSAKATGTSSRTETVSSIIRSNRAGENETHLSEKQLIKAYTPKNDTEFKEWCDAREVNAENLYKEYEEIVKNRLKQIA